MRKRSKYRPKGVRIDTMAYVMSGIKKFDDVSISIDLRIKNHTALDLLCTGKSNKAHIVQHFLLLLGTQERLSVEKI